MSQKYFIGICPKIYIDGSSNISTAIGFPTSAISAAGGIKVKFTNSTGGTTTGYIPVLKGATS